MSWNYRVVRRWIQDGPVEFVARFGIHEAFYRDDEEKPWAITGDAMAPENDDIEALEETLLHMYEALGKPTLDYETREEI